MKMRKVFKRLTAAVLALSMAVSSVPAGAETEEYLSSEELDIYLTQTLPSRMNSINTLSLDPEVRPYIEEYVEEVLPFYLTDYKTTPAEYDISGLIPIHNWEGEDSEKYLVVVAENDMMIGTLGVDYIGDNIISMFYWEYIPELNSAVVNGTPFQLGYSNDCFMIYANGSFTVIENPECKDTSFVNTLTINSADTAVYTLSNTIATAPLARASATIQTPTAVPNVSNANVANVAGDTESEKGLCWAACVAAMVMQAGKASSITAASVFNACKNITISNKPAFDSFGNPSGTKDWILFAFNNIYGMSVVHNGSFLQRSQVIQLLNADKPIYCGLTRENGAYAHAMVLWKYISISANSAKYGFMDPGSTKAGAGYVEAVITDTASIQVHSRNSHTYNTWNRSFYD